MALGERQGDSDWVSAAETYHWCAKDPLIDWLNAFGANDGFVADSHRPGYDKGFDYARFVVGQSWAFKRAVVAWLTAKSPLRMIATNPSQAQDPAKAEQTLAAMKEGVPIIAHAVLWNEDDRLWGTVDLLVRSDVLVQLLSVPHPTLPRERGRENDEFAVPAPGLGKVAYHYRAIDIKFATVHVLKDGTASLEHLPYMVENWIYNQALGKVQGHTPPESYLLGRDLFRAPARIRQEDPQLAQHAAEATAWVRRLRKEGRSWQVLPIASVPELRPNLKSSKDQEWYAAKHEIALAQRDLSLLPYVGFERRARAAASGITRWDD